jgi:3-methyladenine DNA glycosylase AlkD
MTLIEVMDRLHALGTEQNRKTYRRHGAAGELFGVSFANLNKLKKEIRTDHALARELWATGNYDARHLAIMLADPGAATEKELNSWVKDIGDYGVASCFSGFVAATPHARSRMEAWTGSAAEFVGQTGWDTLARMAMNDAALPDEYFERYLGTIEERIRTAKNRVRYSMNGALIAIGIRNEALRKKALAAARRIGKVTVDHGETECRTPEAGLYIEKAWARKKAKRACC